MKKSAFPLMLAAAFAAAFVFATDSVAQRASGSILSEVRIGEAQGCATISVGFNFPIRYVRHFPYRAGDEVRIQLEPIAIGQVDRDALFERETVRPWRREATALLEVVYEGDIPGGPYLTLFFDRQVAFTVAQGSDFRSLIVTVSDPGASAPCREIPAE